MKELIKRICKGCGKEFDAIDSFPPKEYHNKECYKKFGRKGIAIHSSKKIIK